MKVVEIMKLGRNWLEMLQKYCIKIEDVRYIELYEEYVEFFNKGFKKSWSVTHLAEKYGISERKVYYLLKRFFSDCNFDAVG